MRQLAKLAWVTFCIGWASVELVVATRELFDVLTPTLKPTDDDLARSDELAARRRLEWEEHAAEERDRLVDDLVERLGDRLDRRA